MTSRLLAADTPAEAVENIILHTDKVSSAYFSLKPGLKVPAIRHFVLSCQLSSLASDYGFWLNFTTFKGDRLAEEEKDQEGAVVQISPLEEGPD